LEVKKKTAGKNSQPFFREDRVATSFVANKTISALPLPPFKPKD